MKLVLLVDIETNGDQLVWTHRTGNSPIAPPSPDLDPSPDPKRRKLNAAWQQGEPWPGFADQLLSEGDLPDSLVAEASSADGEAPTKPTTKMRAPAPSPERRSPSPSVTRFWSRSTDSFGDSLEILVEDSLEEIAYQFDRSPSKTISEYESFDSEATEAEDPMVSTATHKEHEEPKPIHWSLDPDFYHLVEDSQAPPFVRGGSPPSKSN